MVCFWQVSRLSVTWLLRLAWNSGLLKWACARGHLVVQGGGSERVLNRTGRSEWLQDEDSLHPPWQFPFAESLALGQTVLVDIQVQATKPKPRCFSHKTFFFLFLRIIIIIFTFSLYYIFSTLPTTTTTTPHFRYFTEVKVYSKKKRSTEFWRLTASDNCPMKIQNISNIPESSVVPLSGEPPSSPWPLTRQKHYL